jgi:hypothetical protein
MGSAKKGLNDAFSCRNTRLNTQGSPKKKS